MVSVEETPQWHILDFRRKVSHHEGQRKSCEIIYELFQKVFSRLFHTLNCFNVDKGSLNREGMGIPYLESLLLGSSCNNARNLSV